MGIDINCSCCEGIQDKQIFSFRRKLLDALREYVKNENYEKELKYLNWLVRYDEEDKDRVLSITDEERIEAKELLKEKDLDGLFFWICLEEEDVITPYQAGRFLKTYDKIKDYIHERFLNLSIIRHCYGKGHKLICW